MRYFTSFFSVQVFEIVCHTCSMPPSAVLAPKEIWGYFSVTESLMDPTWLSASCYLMWLLLSFSMKYGARLLTSGFSSRREVFRP